MATALIFAGGAGRRIHETSKPRQFLELHGKPVIIDTLEHFQAHNAVGQIVIVCLKSWIDEMQALVKKYAITKTRGIVPGGETGHDSIYRGLTFMHSFAGERDIVLIHDGVRPLVTEELITQNIEGVRLYGSAITVERVRESVVQSMDGMAIHAVPPRHQMYIARAPQAFRYGEIFRLYQRAQAEGKKTIDPAQLCSIYGFPMRMVVCPGRSLIKIAEPVDFYVYRALHDAMENEQILGI